MPLTNELTGIRWHDVVFLQHFPLTEDTVLDYLRTSPFWDSASINEQARMQSFQGRTVDTSRMEGIEFVVMNHPSPDFFILEKRWKMLDEHTGQMRVQPMERYFIINGDVYLAPDLFQIFSNRAVHLFLFL